MPLKPPPIPERQTVFATLGKGAEIRKRLIAIMQADEYTLPTRIISVGRELETISKLIEEENAESLNDLLSSPFKAENLDLDTVTEEELASALNVMTEMLKLLDERSDSIREYGEAALSYFGEKDGRTERYLKAQKHFRESFPNWEMLFEHILVNHMFFSVFPYQDRPEDMRSEVTALCAVYAFIRFLTLGYMADKSDEIQLIDTLAAAFRLIDHTDFDRYSTRLLKQLGCVSPTDLKDIVAL